MSLDNSGNFSQLNDLSGMRLVNSASREIVPGTTISIGGFILDDAGAGKILGIAETSQLFGGPTAYNPVMLTAGSYSTWFTMGDFGYRMTSAVQGPGGQARIIGTTNSISISTSDNATWASSLSLDNDKSTLGFGGSGYTSDIQIGTASLLINVLHPSGESDSIHISDQFGGIELSVATSSRNFNFVASSPSASNSLFSISGLGVISATLSQMGGTMGYIDNGDAIINGLGQGDLYHTQGLLKIVV